MFLGCKASDGTNDFGACTELLVRLDGKQWSQPQTVAAG
jgi:hypothetical protein